MSAGLDALIVNIGAQARMAMTKRTAKLIATTTALVAVKQTAKKAPTILVVATEGQR
jgi:hypothetical protein